MIDKDLKCILSSMFNVCFSFENVCEVALQEIYFIRSLMIEVKSEEVFWKAAAYKQKYIGYHPVLYGR